MKSKILIMGIILSLIFLSIISFLARDLLDVRGLYTDAKKKYASINDLLEDRSSLSENLENEIQIEDDRFQLDLNAKVRRIEVRVGEPEEGVEKKFRVIPQ